MKIYFFSLLFTFCFGLNAFAFNPNPMDYEFVGQMKNGNGVFYQKSTAKANGQKAEVVKLQADPKNRTLRYYTMILDPDTMTMRAIDCKLYDYKGNLLDSFILPNANTSYKKGDLNDKIYQDMKDKGIIKEPEVPKVVVQYIYVKPIKDWEKGNDGDEDDPPINADGENEEFGAEGENK